MESEERESQKKPREKTETQEAQETQDKGACELSEAVMQMIREMETIEKEIAESGRSQFDTLRLKLLKVAVRVRESARRVWCQLPESFPLARLFQQLLLQGQAVLKPG